MVLILLNLVAAILNLLYFIFTDNRLSPGNLFIAGVCLGVSLTQLAARRF